jgi:hypothetical protein
MYQPPTSDSVVSKTGSVSRGNSLMAVTAKPEVSDPIAHGKSPRGFDT